MEKNSLRWIGKVCIQNMVDTQKLAAYGLAMVVQTQPFSNWGWLCLELGSVYKYVYLCIYHIRIASLEKFTSCVYMLLACISSPAETMHLGAGHDDMTMRSCTYIAHVV